jgi:hypothetical protein
MLNRALIALAGVLAAGAENAATANPYPNEIKGFELYARYLATLQPGQSDAKQVAQVLGSDRGKQLVDWKVTASYSCMEADGVCAQGLGNDRLFSLELTPKQRVSLSHFKFPAAFTRRYGRVSQPRVTCNVYADEHGLQYWIISDDTSGYKRGDLLKIDYGFHREER